MSADWHRDAGAQSNTASQLYAGLPAHSGTLPNGLSCEPNAD
jgi:hypothetical protein